MENSAILAVKLGLLVIASPENPFKSRSGQGKKYLIDSRGAGTNIPLRELIISEMSHRLQNFKEYDIIGGIAKSGTTWGAWLSWHLRLPFANILLDGKRGTGLQREVEGDIENKNVILIDNWVRSGSSIVDATEVVKRNKGNVVGVIVITKLNHVALEMNIQPIWDIEELFEAARITNLVSKDFKFHS